MLHAHVDIHTPFHIDPTWWTERGRSLRRFLAEIAGITDSDLVPADPLDYIDLQTAEVFQIDPLWVNVLTTQARRPDYITAQTPLTNAVLRAFVENVNRPMSAVDLQRRIGRSDPATLLKVLRTARHEYGIVPVATPAP